MSHLIVITHLVSCGEDKNTLGNGGKYGIWERDLCLILSFNKAIYKDRVRTFHRGAEDFKYNEGSSPSIFWPKNNQRIYIFTGENGSPSQDLKGKTL